MAYDIILLNYDWNKTMKSSDWQDMDNVRNQAIAQLAEICAAMGLSWSATEKEYIIQLPNLIVMKGGGGTVVSEQPTTRKSFDISKWGENSGVYEGSMYKSDDPMPDYGEILEEGESPKGDPNAEN